MEMTSKALAAKWRPRTREISLGNFGNDRIRHTAIPHFHNFHPYGDRPALDMIGRLRP
jgi:hypothetical protein